MAYVLENSKENASANALSKIICLLFHPLVLGLFVLSATDYLAHNSLSHALYWSGIVAGFSIVMGLFYIVLLNQKGKSDFEEIKEIRPRLYGGGFVLSLIMLSLFYWLNAPVSLIVCIIAGMALILLMALVNYFLVEQVPISAMACGASFALAIVMGMAWLSLLMLCIMLITGWARNKVNGHTWTAIVMGWFLSIPMTYSVITILLNVMA